ncbi:Uncharacterised protein [Mannheimia haemolytica]|uniref:Uncharacterized protein n=1 Tax=Mannheimia haemolytica TaxID=75985 RepID=A0A3S4WYY6_MANHA|nr:hypothetical protein [Mannheimia haemolytica]VEI76903.1 Uncharacterised protein [Mannheimia haemolytica]HDV7284359.1 hypothetical protein [Mannheimia haemolytica]
MNNPYHNVSQEYLDYLAKKVKQGQEDIKNGRIYSPKEVRKRVIAAAFRGAENAKKVA